MYVVGVDVGATNYRVALASADGRVLNYVQEKQAGKNFEKTFKKITSDIKSFGKKIEAIGVGSAGPMNKAKDSVKIVNLSAREIPIVKLFKKVFKVPVYLLNDAVAGVVAEKIFGAGKRVDNLVYVTLSTGIGAGIYVDGNLLSGKNGNAHEVGHMVIDAASDLVCGCGHKGHWEAFCGGRNIPRFAKKISGKNFTAKSLFDSAKAGDKTALHVVKEIGRLNAIGIANIVNMYDPELITVGGKVALYNKQLILKPILKNLDQHIVNRKPRIMATSLGEEIVVRGAVAAALEKQKL